MKVKKLNSKKYVLIRTHKYLIDWKNDGDSKLEIKFRDLIKPYWDTQIVLFQCRIPGSLLRIDFLNCNKRIAIEVNGPQHEDFNKLFFKGKMDWVESMKRDMDKRKWCDQNKIDLLELIEEDLYKFSPQYIKEKFGINII